MSDIVDKETRSRMMSGIRSKNTKPEILIRKGLYHRGYRYRLHVKKIPGNPDIVLRKYNSVIFINGCFWHKHNCHLFKWPKSNIEFWKKKILKNVSNDIKNQEILNKSKWKIAIIWECSLKGKEKLDIEIILDKITQWLNNDSKRLEITGCHLNSKKNIQR